LTSIILFFISKNLSNETPEKKPVVIKKYIVADSVSNTSDLKEKVLTVQEQREVDELTYYLKTQEEDMMKTDRGFKIGTTDSEAGKALSQEQSAKRLAISQAQYQRQKAEREKKITLNNYTNEKN
jgi:uncharacterized small protein (DUF1192 family)